MSTQSNVKQLAFLDRYLTLWIFLAMLIGILIGNIVPNMDQKLDALSYGTTNIPLAIGLILMMYPPLTKVQFSKIPSILSKPKLLLASFFITWVVGPFLIFFIISFP